jgi:hypothetical protein
VNRNEATLEVDKLLQNLHQLLSQYVDKHDELPIKSIKLSHYAYHNLLYKIELSNYSKYGQTVNFSNGIKIFGIEFIKNE